MQLVKSRTTKVIVGSLLVLTGVGACSGHSGSSSGAKNDTKIQTNNYNRLQSQDPAHTMQTSPTRSTINFWIDTWGKPGVKSYVYIQDNGVIKNHYVFDGLPVSYCTSLTPNYNIIQDKNDDGQMSVPAPGVDGVYYSGGQCNEYYGKDATTGVYVEYSIGLDQNQLIFSQPLPGQNVPSIQP